VPEYLKPLSYDSPYLIVGAEGERALPSHAAMKAYPLPALGYTGIDAIHDFGGGGRDEVYWSSPEPDSRIATGTLRYAASRRRTENDEGSSGTLEPGESLDVVQELQAYSRVQLPAAHCGQ
jgi:hypothetical protein